ncbi:MULTISPECIES: type I polyketide synthase [Actinomyces]|uniref:type I polyketide synthase n=1 Tax=Actinomyces TaxID=1654 RepID=UPI0013566BFC|nr:MULTISPECIES: type I polyketide synthase [Actinomyces]
MTGELSSPVILAQVLERHPDAKIWIRGGVGRHTARGLIAAGAAGVVLDVQLALMPESDASDSVRRILEAPSLPRPVRCDGEQVLPDARGLYSEVSQRERRFGDDALIANLFCHNYESVHDAVIDLTSRIEGAADTWRSVYQLNILNARAAHAQHTGIPFIQGPMTRVSDVPEFVEEICDAEALGTLALAAANPAQAKAMLTQAESVLRGRTWAVGMLGFLDEDLVRQHIDLVRKTSASAVVLAGGRPYQEKLLREAGKQCFVHVPSPDVLRTFVAAGARCYVFEGAECGGHVGPLYSLPLWEMQISVLLALVSEGKVDAADLVIAMAGGIHDSSSAAMALLTAADLVERGAAVSFLMGTMYSLTADAIRTGAVTQDYCDVVIGATASARLETAPGHVTRCAPTNLVDEIELVRENMTRAGESDRNIWKLLEEMTLGRLRMATKGITRDGNEMRPVPVPVRHDQGLYMTGEVSLLARSVCKIDELHERIMGGLNDIGERLSGLGNSRRMVVSEKHSNTETAWGDGIAIIGMSGLFPGGGGLSEFWSNVLQCKELVTDVPERRWDPKIFCEPGARNAPRSDSARGAFLPAVPFDPVCFGIPPRSLASIEPVQLLALEAAGRALIDADLVPGEVTATTSVVFGAESGSELSSGMALRTGLPAFTGCLPDAFEAALPELTGDSFPGMLANVVSGRVANRLDLSGSNFVVDAACASSLAALKTACHELILGDCDIALAGGADTHNGIGDYVMFSSVGALSKTGRSRPFDKDADGIVLGEAVACVVLKRVADALRDGDRIYATIRGIGSSSDGRASGLTAPRSEGQLLALERAYKSAGVDPLSVGLIEAHGTGTVLGDRTELQALTDFMTAHGAERGQCVIGSVKSQIGHTKCAAGMVGLVKAALSVNQAQLPPTAALTHPNPVWDAESSPFVFRDKAAPWPREPSERVAGVSAFGFGGTNYHCVLTGEHSTVRRLLDPTSPMLAAIRGDSRDSARAAARAALDMLVDGRSGSDAVKLLLDRYTSSRSPVQVAFTFRTVDELERMLSAVVDGEAVPGVHVRAGTLPDTPRLAVLFSGQGAQRTSMAQTVLEGRPDLSWLVQGQSSIASDCYPPLRFTREEIEEDDHRLRRTDRAQRLLAMAELSGWMAFSELGADVAMLAGHSFGELVALTAGGSMSSATLYSLARVRGEAMRRTGDGGSMSALRAGIDEAAALLQRDGDSSLSIANINSPSQVVIGGPQHRVEAIERAAAQAGIASRRLAVSAAFHTKQMEPASAEFAATAEEMILAPPTIPVYRNNAGTPYGEQDNVGEVLASQMSSQVDFVRMVRAMVEDGATTFLEIGPGRVLANSVAATTGVECLSFDLNASMDVLPDLAARLLTLGIDLNAGWIRRAMRPTAAFGSEFRGIVIDGMGVDTRGEVIEGLTRKPRRRVRLAEAFAPSTAAARTLTAVRRPVPATKASKIEPDVQGPTAEAENTERSPRSDKPLGRPVALDLTRVFERQGQSNTAGERKGASAHLLENARHTVSHSERKEQLTTVNNVVVEYLNASTKIAEHQANVVRWLVGHDTERGGAEMLPPVVEGRTEHEGEWLLESSSSRSPKTSSPDVEFAGPVETRTLQVSSAVSRSETSPSTALDTDLADMRHDTPGSETGMVLGVSSGSVSGSDGGGNSSTLDVHDVVLSVIGERTGYPATMIEDELDLESDLGIDSIKRLEIAGDLVRECGLDADGMADGELEDLSKSRTVAAMTQWLLKHLDIADTHQSDDDAGMVLGVSSGSVSGSDGGGNSSTLDVHDVVLSVIGERTGYPATMIEDELDLESDLGIDSIKRLEIAGDLVRECGLDADGMADGELEDLSKSRTVAAMTQWLLKHLDIADTHQDNIDTDIDIRPDTAESEVVDSQPFRFEVRLSEPITVRQDNDAYPVRRLIRTDRPEDSGALASEVCAAVYNLDVAEVPPGGVVIDFADDRGADRELPCYFDTLKRIALVPGLGGLFVVRRVVCDSVDGTPDRGVDGIRGLMRTLALELPDVRVQYTEVDLPEADDATCVRRALELTHDSAPVHVITERGTTGFELVPVPLDTLGRTGSGPSDGIVEGLSAIGLGPGRTLVFFGGGRGITSVVAKRLSSLCPGYTYICGSSAIPRDNDPQVLRGAETLIDLRKALQRDGFKDLGEIENEARRVLSEREIRDTLAGLESSGSIAEYRCVDVRDAQAVEEFLASVVQERGRIDGVVFGSGINRDQLLSRTSRDQFDRVYRTKQDGIDNVLRGLDACEVIPGFVIGFGSIAAVRGSRGQIGYAAGNDGMQSTLTRWGRQRGVRTFTVNWGPWAPHGIHAGMVSAELERSFLANGRSLIHPSAGAEALVRELVWGPRDCRSVVYLPRGWE